MDKEELSIVHCPADLLLCCYFINPLQRALVHTFRHIFMRRVSTFTLEVTFSYTSKERVVKQISLKDIPLGTGDPLKETKVVIEYENDEQVRKSTGGTLKKKEIIRGEYDKQVQMITGDPLKKKDMLIDEKGKLVGT